MKTTENPTFYIGEFTLSPATNPMRAVLPYNLPEKSSITLKLFDKFGITCRKVEFLLKKGSSHLELDCNQLSGGDYSAWIELEGKTYLRGFYIKEPEKKKNFFERIIGKIQTRGVDPLYY